MMGFIDDKKAMTVIEMLLAILMISLILGSSLTIYSMAMTSWKEGGVQIALQRQASIAIEKMLRGVDGRNGIREAESATVVGISIINFTSGIDGIERSFYLSGNQIMHDPDTSTGGDEYSIADDTSMLTFAVSGNVVTISLNMQDTVRNNTINAGFSTMVRVRNY